MDFCTAKSPFVPLTSDMGHTCRCHAYQDVVESAVVVDGLVCDAAGLAQVVEAVGGSQRQRLCDGTGDKVSGGLRGNGYRGSGAVRTSLLTVASC